MATKRGGRRSLLPEEILMGYKSPRDINTNVRDNGWFHRVRERTTRAATPSGPTNFQKELAWRAPVWSREREASKKIGTNKERLKALRRMHVIDIKLAAQQAGMSPKEFLKLRNQEKGISYKTTTSTPAAATTPKAKSGPGPWGMSNERAAKMRAQVAKVKPAATKGGVREGGSGSGGG